MVEVDLGTWGLDKGFSRMYLGTWGRLRTFGVTDTSAPRLLVSPSPRLPLSSSPPLPISPPTLSPYSLSPDMYRSVLNFIMINL